MPNEARIHRSSNSGPSSTSMNRVPYETSSLLRRAASILIGIWFGGILMVALSAPAAFRSVDTHLAAPTEATAKALKALGPTTVREILHYQVGEANRLMFESWGWVQSALGAAIFVMLLFGTTVGRPALGIALGQFLMALLMQFIMIPRITEIGRQMRSGSTGQPQDLVARFRAMHLGFTAFELAVVLLGSALLVLLLRRAGGRRRSDSESV